MYGCSSDPHIKSAIRATSVLKDVLLQCAHLSDMLEEITKSAEKEFNIPKAAAVEETSSKKTDTGAFSLVEELGQKIVDVDDDQQLEQWKVWLLRLLARAIVPQ